MTADEVEELCRDAGGVPVQFNGQQTWGLVREPDEDAFSGFEATSIVQARSVLVATTKLTGLTPGTSISVDGTDYTIINVRRESDGAETRIELQD